MRIKTILLLGALALATVGGGAQPAHAAGLTFFTTRAGFDFSAPGLPLENFETGNVADGNIVECNRPLSTDNDIPVPPPTGTGPDPCFKAGTLKPGIVYTTAPGGDPMYPNGYDPALAAVGKGAFFNDSKYLLSNWDVDFLELDFPAPANSVGLDLYNLVTNQTCAIEIYDASGLKGTTSLGCSRSPAFFGVQSDTLITKIIFKAPLNNPQTGDGWEGVDNVEFGQVDFSVTKAHPALLDTSGPTVTLTLSANLSTGNGAPIAGQTIHFEVGGSDVCTGVTNAAGFASCGGPVEVLGVAISPTMTYTARFNGGSGFGRSSGSAGLIA